MSEFEGFVPPTRPPQLEAEAHGAIRDLILDAPEWDEAFAFELAVLARRHQVIRSALKYTSTLADYCKDLMVNEKDPIELYRRQGAVKALQQAFHVIVQNLQSTQPDEEFES